MRRFVAEDAIPGAVLRELVREWASETATVFMAVVPDDGAEQIRRELVAERPDAACVTLLNRAVELIPLRPDVRLLHRSARHDSTYKSRFSGPSR